MNEIEHRPPFFRGEWLERGLPGYDEARPVFNQRIDRRPAVIARCCGVADVIGAVTHARGRGLQVDVRSTGLDIGGDNTGDGLVIDLSPMRGIQVLPERRIARIQGGVRGGDLQIEAALHGLGAVTGVLSSSGVGLLLGGGLGFLSSRVGWASESILSIELVTAEGEVVTASPDENPDLYWAVRGAPGAFGVITALEVRLHDVPPLVHAASAVWSLDNLHGPMEALRTLPRWASQDLSIVSLMSSAVLDGHGGYELFACHTGPSQQAKADLDRLISSGSPDLADISEIPFRDLHFANDALFPSMRVVVDEQPVSALDDDLIETLVAKIREPAEGAARFVEVTPRVGAFGREPEAPSVLREGPERPTWSLGPGCWYENGSEDAIHADWTRQVIAEIRRLGAAEGGMHPNSIGIAVDLEGLERMYGDRLPRLREIKGRWDPGGVFTGNHDIPPA